MKPTLLLIDDDNEFRSDFILLLNRDFDVIQASDSTTGFTQIQKSSPDVVLLDLMLQDGSNGLELLKKIKGFDKDLPVIMITDYASVPTAVEALKIGAEDYISKTPNLDEFKVLIKKILSNKLNLQRIRTIEEESQRKFSELIGTGKAITELKKQIELFSENKNTVLITGESGVGKELVARQIHYNSGRSSNPFVAINCAAIPRELIESELFGHEKGAFTGALQKRPGKFELAAGGTLFLDEVSELDADAQVKLLRVVQFKEFNRLGGNKNITTNARIIAATNKDLSELVTTGEFRQDLYFRLNVLPINVPPLRERLEDIPELIEHFIRAVSLDLKSPPRVFSSELLSEFSLHDWPGNIRELQNYITRVLISTAGNPITPEETGALFPSNKVPGTNRLKIPESWQEMDKLRKEESDRAARNVEKLFLENLLNRFDGNVSKAAEHIGINRTNLHKMINKCGL